ncbi:MAG TPA: hypothetical protein VJN22_05510, partial [Candidatus Eremiobacteraceae bacterium]|nr:hypothetical protein [Candidatus Eremiobacteraceae bacterium]
MPEPAYGGVAHDLTYVGHESAAGQGILIIAGREASQQLFLANGPDPARHALPARLIFEERRDPPQDDEQIDGLVEDH